MARQPSPRDTRCISAAFSFLKTADYSPNCFLDIDLDGFGAPNPPAVDCSCGLEVSVESITTALSKPSSCDTQTLNLCLCDLTSSPGCSVANGISFDKKISERVIQENLNQQGTPLEQQWKHVEQGAPPVQQERPRHQQVTLHQQVNPSEEKAAETAVKSNSQHSVKAEKKEFSEKGLNLEQMRTTSNGSADSYNSGSSPVWKLAGCDHCDSGFCDLDNLHPDPLTSNEEEACSTEGGPNKKCCAAVNERTKFSGMNTDITAKEDTVRNNTEDKTGAGVDIFDEHKTETVDETEVEMRPNRRSLGRRSTETAVISDVFHFLPSSGTESVFLPTTLDDRTRGRCSEVMTLSVVAEEGKDLGAKQSINQKRGHVCKNVESFSSVDDFKSPGDAGVLAGRGLKESASLGAEQPDVKLRHPRLSKQDSVTEEDGSGDSSDEDAGIYAASFRRSNWMRVDDNGEIELAFPAVDGRRASPAVSRSSEMSSDWTDGNLSETSSPRILDDQPVFVEKCPSPHLYISHKRSDSNSTTLSEKEFKKEYLGRRRFLIQRKNSSVEYHRFSAKVYDEEKKLMLVKAPTEMDFGIHILDSQPAYITKVDVGSAAERAGLEEGQILIALNGINVLSLSHKDIVTLISNCPSSIQIDVAISDFQPSRDLQAPIMQGHMQKLGGSSSIMKRWKKRYFILRQDSCLYYYKQGNETDPLGAIPLAGYTFSRHLDSGRDYCFKAEKYGARTYYFMTESRDEMTEWVGALLDAAGKAKKRKDSFVSVSSHNVGIPALEVRRPECTGYLLKVGHRHKSWKRRYCVLKDACLYYYKNVNSLNALGVAHLQGYKVDPSISIGKKHAFGLIPPDESLRTFHFSAENDTDRLRWVDAMIRSIQRWIQIDNDC